MFKRTHAKTVSDNDGESATLQQALISEHQRLLNIIEFLPDATFVIDENKRVVAWNRACELLTGVKKDAVLGKGDYIYAEAFFGKRCPILIDLLDMPSEIEEEKYKFIKRNGDSITAESFIGRLHGGKGAHLCGIASPLYNEKGERTGAIEVIRDMTEQKQVEEALRISELKHRMLFETANDAILLMSRDHFVDCNARALTMFGCNRDEMVGAAPYEYSPPRQPDGRPSQEGALERIEQALAGRPQFFEWLHCRRDKTPFMAEVSLNCLDIGGELMLQAIVRDISDRKMAEEAARLSQKYINFLSKFANDIIILLDEQFRFLEVNDRTLDCYGYTREEMVGMHATQLRAQETKEGFLEQIGVVEALGSSVYETVHQRKDGSRFPVEISLRLIISDGKRFFQAIIRDITERKEAQDALKRANAELELRVDERTRELKLANERLMELDRLKSMFIASMSHELRTPLNSIIGFTGIILNGLTGDLNDEQRKQLGMVKSSARHLLALINDVIDVSKIEAEKIQLSVEVLDLADAVKEMADSFAVAVSEKGLNLSVLRKGSVVIKSDERRVRQIAMNLLSNAVKFTDVGVITVSVEAIGDKAVITVSDTGTGVKSEDMGRLFKQFSRIVNEGQAIREGTGLGLYLSQKLAVLLGGEITAESEFGKGSTFRLILPLKK